MKQDRLFRLAHEGIAINAYFEPGRGWHLIIRMRRGDELWQDGADFRYSDLTTDELADVLCATVHSELGLI